MRQASPLRYPGGKASLAPALASIMDANALDRPVMAEPYAGAAGAALELLFAERVESILINDLDHRIYCFWWSVLNRTEEFLERIAKAKLSMREWRRQLKIYRASRNAHPWLDVGFATFYLNRTNRSGILVNGGPIGGINQDGKWKLDARFTKSSLADRVDRVAAYKERIHISNLDAVEFLDQLRRTFTGRQLFVYMDPPYYVQGASLYLSDYEHDDHAHVAKAVQLLKKFDWVVTYDNVAAIRRIYDGCQQFPFTLSYTAHRRRKGRELLIAKPGMKITPQMVGTRTWR